MASGGPTYDEVRRTLAAQYAVVIEGLAALDPAGPTDCAGWTVQDLETHLALTARSLARIAAAGTAQASVTGGMNEWAAQLAGFAAFADEAARAERLALAPQLEAVVRALAEHPEDVVVEQITGRHTLKDAATFRLVEAVVHGLDVGIDPYPPALKVVVKALARSLAQSHPGRTVEVRVPPYAAVQCLSGPRHTRGTPPNVVEADPVAWVQLCTGRQTWADLVRNGRVRASGERSDLSALLPLLR